MIMLAQGLFIVKGKTSMSGQLIIAIINGSKRFDFPVRWEERQNPWGVRAYNSIEGEMFYGEWIDDKLIGDNNWASNSLWRTQKGLMSRYRSATYFARLYAPDLLMGFTTEGETDDIQVVEPVKTEKVKIETVETVEVVEDAEIEDATTVEEIKSLFNENKRGRIAFFKELFNKYDGWDVGNADLNEMKRDIVDEIK